MAAAARGCGWTGEADVGEVRKRTAAMAVVRGREGRILLVVMWSLIFSLLVVQVGRSVGMCRGCCRQL